MQLDDKVRQQLKARDGAFLKKTFEEINPYLHRLLGSRGYYGEQAEDVIYETWLTFLEKIDQFEGRSSIRTYLSGILFHKIQEQNRANKKFLTIEEDLDDHLDQSFTEDGWWKQKPADPDVLFSQKEAGEFIRQCLETLTPQQSQAFLMKEVEGEETEDISRALGVTVSHLGVLIFRSKEKLRKCIEGLIASPRKTGP